jgi:glycosyltransferase involved in cell wall biosynthesis
MLERITPLVLTFNEAPNIGRTLGQLGWARDIVVVDSFSSDDTLEIISRFPQVRLYQRKFDRHDLQWDFALKQTCISTDWVMALDADFMLSPLLIDEIKNLEPEDAAKGYCARLIFCINGKHIRSSLCPPATFLYRRASANYVQDGHTQKLKLDGRVDLLTAPIVHDDRKSLSRWVISQKQYAILEAEKIRKVPLRKLDFADRIRKLGFVAPPAIFVYCFIVRGGVLDGWAGFYYAFQRVVAEALLTRYLIAAILNRVLGRHSVDAKPWTDQDISLS